MEEALKIINECVLYKDNENDKEDRLNKLDNIRKILYSEFERGYGYISTNLYDLIDEIPVMIINKSKYVVGDSFSIFQRNKNQEKEIVDKFTELRNSILNILVEESNIVFVAQ